MLLQFRHVKCLLLALAERQWNELTFFTKLGRGYHSPNKVFPTSRSQWASGNYPSPNRSTHHKEGREQSPIWLHLWALLHQNQVKFLTALPPHAVLTLLRSPPPLEIWSPASAPHTGLVATTVPYKSSSHLSPSHAWLNPVLTAAFPCTAYLSLFFLSSFLQPEVKM